MKEYNFEPPSRMIEVTEGASVSLTVYGKRVAFRSVSSIFKFKLCTNKLHLFRIFPIFDTKVHVQMIRSDLNFNFSQLPWQAFKSLRYVFQLLWIGGVAERGSRAGRRPRSRRRVARNVPHTSRRDKDRARWIVQTSGFEGELPTSQFNLVMPGRVFFHIRS